MTLPPPQEEAYLSPSLEDELIAYRHLKDRFWRCLKQQACYEFFYWKEVAFFVLAAIISFILQEKGIVSSAFFLIHITGIGCLLVFFLNIKMDFKYDREMAACIDQGLPLEKKLKFPVKFFGIFEDNRSLSYQNNLLSRLFPMELIGTGTAYAAIVLSTKAGIWLPTIVTICSIITLWIASQSYIKKARKILLRKNSLENGNK